MKTFIFTLTHNCIDVEYFEVDAANYDEALAALVSHAGSEADAAKWAFAGAN